MMSLRQAVTARTLAVAAMLACIMSPAAAAPIALTFEGLGNDERILDFYDGGIEYAAEGGTGTPGPDLGVAFNDMALAKVDLDSGVPGANGNFANEPSPDTILFFNTGSAILNFAAGFDTGFSFFYSAAEAASVTIWSEVGATGTLLGTIALAANSTANDCVGDPNPDGSPEPIAFCNWDPIGVAFQNMTDIARSIDFSGAAARAGFDNVTFGSINPVPLPAGIWFLTSGLLGFFALRRRRSADCARSVVGSG